MTSLSDEALAQSLRAGRGEAMDLLFARYGGPLLGFLQRMVGNRDTAEDLLQETMLRVLRGISSYRETGRFRPWIYRIAANLAVSHLRRTRPGVAEPEALLQGLPDPGAPDPHVELERLEDGRALRIALASLPEEQRTVLLLRVTAGMPVAEVASALCLPEGTVKSRLHYAVVRMRALHASLQPATPEGRRS